MSDWKECCGGTVSRGETCDACGKTYDVAPASALVHSDGRRLEYGLDFIKAMPDEWTDEQRWARMVELYDELKDQHDKILETLLYMELHVGRYEWSQLTTEQKNLLADLIDEGRAKEYPDDHEPMERWWQ